VLIAAPSMGSHLPLHLTNRWVIKRAAKPVENYVLESRPQDIFYLKRETLFFVDVKKVEKVKTAGILRKQLHSHIMHEPRDGLQAFPSLLDLDGKDKKTLLANLACYDLSHIIQGLGGPVFRRKV